MENNYCKPYIESERSSGEPDIDSDFDLDNLEKQYVGLKTRLNSALKDPFTGEIIGGMK